MTDTIATPETVTLPLEEQLLPVELFAHWLFVGRRGMSSNAIVAQLTGIGNEHAHDHPYDNGDFGRCQRLLDWYPQIRPHFDARMPLVSLEWAALVAVWDDIAFRATEAGGGSATWRIRQLLDQVKKGR